MIAVASGSTDARGMWIMNLAVPNSPGLAGVPIVTQALILRAVGPVLGAGDLTQAMAQVVASEDPRLAARAVEPSLRTGGVGAP